MKSLNHRKKRTSLLALTLVTLAIAVVGGALYAYYVSQKDVETTKSDNGPVDTKEETIQAEPAEKQAAAEASNDDVDPSLAPSEVPEAENVSVSIQHAAQKDMVVSYRAAVTGASTGTCNAQFTSTYGRPISKVSKLSNGVCSQDINAVEFDALGEWALTLYFYTDNTKVTDRTILTIR